MPLNYFSIIGRVFELSLGEILQKGYVGWVLQYEQEFIRGP